MRAQTRNGPYPRPARVWVGWLALSGLLPAHAQANPDALPGPVQAVLGQLAERGGLLHPADDSKAVEGRFDKLVLSGKEKRCCGYPLGEPQTYKMTFYWLAFESEYANEPRTVELYTRGGWVLGRFAPAYAFELKMEGSGVLRDGRVVNYDGRCAYGIGTCYQTLDVREHPLGKGGQGRALVPFRSVAVDPRFVPLGTPLYLPELSGMLLPDGTRHDGCVRADDTGGNIKKRELDFFVESYAYYKFLDDALSGHNKVTPFIEEPRCQYLRGKDEALDRRSESTDWQKLHEHSKKSGPKTHKLQRHHPAGYRKRNKQ